MSKDICPDCGRDRNIVGKAHRCVPVPGWTKQVADFLAGPEPAGEPATYTELAKSKPVPRGKLRPKKPAETDDDIAIKRLAVPAPEKSAKPRPENRKDKKVVTAYLEPEQVKRLRVMAAQTGVSMETMLGKIIDAEWLARQRRKET